VTTWWSHAPLTLGRVSPVAGFDPLARVTPFAVERGG
jgi:hypothetical protein